MCPLRDINLRRPMDVDEDAGPNGYAQAASDRTHNHHEKYLIVKSAFRHDQDHFSVLI